MIKKKTISKGLDPNFNPFIGREPNEVWVELKAKSRPMTSEEKEKELNDLKERTLAKKKLK